HLSNLHEWNLEFCRVIAGLEAFALSKDAEHRRVSIRDPTPKDETAHENHDARKKTLEKIEDADCADANKVEDSALDAQVREGLVKALEDSVLAPWSVFLHDGPSLLK